MAFTFRPSKDAMKTIEQIKKDADIVTNSKAVEYALRNFLVMEKELKDTYSNLEKSDRELIEMKKTIIIKYESDLYYNKMISELVSK